MEGQAQILTYVFGGGAGLYIITYLDRAGACCMYRNSRRLYFSHPFRTFQLDYLIAGRHGDRKKATGARWSRSTIFLPCGRGMVSKSITDLFGISRGGSNSWPSCRIRRSTIALEVMDPQHYPWLRLGLERRQKKNQVLYVDGIQRYCTVRRYGYAGSRNAVETKGHGEKQEWNAPSPCEMA